MNLRLFVFLVLGALSSVASANWFDAYQAEASSEVAAKVEVSRDATVTQSYSHKSNLLEGHYYAPINIYFMPESSLPKVVLAPSFDVVAREMQQIKEEQISQEYALITYLQKDRAISVE